MAQVKAAYARNRKLGVEGFIGLDYSLTVGPSTEWFTDDADNEYEMACSIDDAEWVKSVCGDDPSEDDHYPFRGVDGWEVYYVAVGVGTVWPPETWDKYEYVEGYNYFG